MEPHTDETSFPETSQIERSMTVIASSVSEPFAADIPPQPTSSESRSACRAAVNDDRDRIAQRLNDDVIRGLFGVGLRLQATAQMADGAVQARLALAIHDVDLIIAEVRRVIFDCYPYMQLSSDELPSDATSPAPQQQP